MSDNPRVELVMVSPHADARVLQRNMKRFANLMAEVVGGEDSYKEIGLDIILSLLLYRLGGNPQAVVQTLRDLVGALEKGHYKRSDAPRPN